jgi:hypothetical protein
MVETSSFFMRETFLLKGIIRDGRRRRGSGAVRRQRSGFPVLELGVRRRFGSGMADGWREASV